MFTRQLRPKDGSFFLFGARGTGKTTWLKQHFPEAARYDLLRAGESLRLSRDPGLLTAECSALPEGAWIVLDEVQRVPALLDEVQHLMTERKQRFVLCGSSARKLRRGGANLLAGRAELLHLFPLVTGEVGFDRDLDDILAGGMLPLAVLRAGPRAFLRSYCEVYLKEEIQAEALVRQIGPFHRFLDVVARVNAQTTNVTGVARDAGIARQTAQEYFQILIDTLLAYWLPAWKLKRAVKQVAHPKLYLFDCGVARELAGVGHLPLHPEERGALLETFLLNEVRALLHYRELHWPMAYWRTHEGLEVDLVIEAPDRLVAIECKAADRWDKRFHSGLVRLRELQSERQVDLYGVYRGGRAMVVDGVRVLPWREFLERLWSDALLGSP